MAFTESQLNAQLDPTGTNKTVQIVRFIPDNTPVTPVTIQVYAVPVNGYSGNSGWYTLTYSNTAAQAAAQLLALLI
jgi:hypothetical protein